MLAKIKVVICLSLQLGGELAVTSTASQTLLGVRVCFFPGFRGGVCLTQPVTLPPVAPEPERKDCFQTVMQ